MKILRIFGIVVGIHVFALILIFANPGCSAMTKTTPPPADATAKADTASPAITVPLAAAGDSATGFDPNAPAISVSAGVHYSPTRPGTAAAGALETEPVGDVTPVTTYTVSKGDSLWTIAHKNHITKAELAAANNLKSEATIRIGQKLIIPGKSMADSSGVAKSAGTATKSAAPDMAATPKGPADSVKHVVKPGETLSAIAHKYQVKLSDLATANNVADPSRLRPGTELIIPGWQTPGSKSAKSGTKGATKSSAEASKPAAIPTISVSTADQDAMPAVKPATDSPPVITVEDAPPAKKP